MEIKEIDREVTYYEKAQLITVEINGKKVKLSSWNKEDHEMSNYENDHEIVEGKELLTDEEEDDLMDWFYDNR